MEKLAPEEDKYPENNMDGKRQERKRSSSIEFSSDEEMSYKKDTRYDRGTKQDSRRHKLGR